MFLSGRCRNALFCQCSCNAGRRFPIHKPTIDVPNNLCLLRHNFRQAICSFSIAQKMLVRQADLAVRHSLSLSPSYILRNRTALLLCQTGHNGDQQLALGIQRVDVFFFKHNPIAIITYCIVEKCRVYAEFVCLKMYIDAYRIPSFYRFKHQINAMLNEFLCPNQHGVCSYIQLTVPST